MKSAIKPDAVRDVLNFDARSKGSVGSASTTILFASVLFIAASCSPKAPTMTLDGSATDNPTVETIFRQSCESFSKGDVGVADEGFARIIREFPDDPMVRASTIYRARIAMKLDNPKRARALLAPIKGDKDAVADRATLYDGRALFQLGDIKESIRELLPLVDRLTDQEDIRVLETTLWNAAEKENNIELAAAAVHRLLPNLSDAGERRDVLHAFKKLLIPIIDVTFLSRIVQTLPKESEVAAAIEGRIAEIHLDAGRFDQAAEILDRLDKNKSDRMGDVESDAVSSSEEVALKTVGLLVPLSGRDRLIGDAAVKGASLGAKEAGFRLVVKDSKSTSEEASLGVETLVGTDRAVAVIGSLTGSAADEAAQKAESLKVPILVLSAKEEIPASGDFVFREFAGNKIEPAALVGIARARGASRFGVLFPDNGYGRAVRAMFAAAVKAEDLTLVAEVSYSPDAVSFKEQAERLAGESMDALFIPDRASTLALIAPALAAAGVWSFPIGEPFSGIGKPVQLLVPSVGFSEDLIRRAGRYLEGALFSVFFAPEVIPASKDFALRYHLEYGTRPSIVSAYAYDSALIIGRALEDDIRSRSDLRRWLIETASSAAPSLNTAAPFSGFTVNGAPKALPYVLSLNNSKATIVDMNGIQIAKIDDLPEDGSD